jgi:CRP/FNR family transcriptional regulator, anaerobic regulatory protein
MKDQLITFFSSVDPIKEVHQNLMHEHTSILSIKKGMHFYEEGKVCNRIGYVIEGVLRVVQINDDGTQITRYFINEGHFGVDLESYSNLTPAKEYQEALTDCTLVIMTREAMNLFYEEIPNFRKIISTITEKALLEKYNVKSEMFIDDAPTRYSKLMARNPNIIQRVPLGMISSYLGVSPYTLSRIRKQYK